MSSLRNLVIVLILSIGLLGCGKENADISNTEEVESVQDNSEIIVEEIDTQEESSVENAEKEEFAEAELEQNTDTNPMVDWETFAAQEGNGEICLAILNEKTYIQTILYEGGFYPYKEDDRIAIPIKSNIQRIDYYAVNEDGTMKGEIIQIYWKDSNATPQKYIEFEVGNEVGYYISIFDENNNKISFAISTIAEIE